MLIGSSGGNNVTLPGATLLDGFLVTLGASVNNLTQSGLGDVSQLLINALTALNVTGIAGAIQNRLLYVSIAPQSSTVTLVNGSGASLAGNRLNIPAGNLALTAGSTAVFVCMDPARGWELVASSIASGGGGGGGYGIGSSTVVPVSAAPVGSQNNYAPAGWSAATVNQFRLTPTGGDATLTGLDATGVADNWTCILTNDDAANNLILANESASSVAANRFTGWGGGDIVIVPGQMCLLARVGTRWRIR